MKEKEWIAWDDIDSTIQEKIDELREEESQISDPITMSFLQVHEEILLNLRDDLAEHKTSEEAE